MADSNTWICSNCRSINEGRSRCYSCRAPRTLELDLSDTSISLLGQHRRALALRLYPPVLDYLYWCGVREAERDTAAGAT